MLQSAGLNVSQTSSEQRGKLHDLQRYEDSLAWPQRSYRNKQQQCPA